VKKNNETHTNLTASQCRLPLRPQAKVDTLKRLQAETGAELDALMPAVLDRAFKGEL